MGSVRAGNIGPGWSRWKCMYVSTVANRKRGKVSTMETEVDIILQLLRDKAFSANTGLHGLTLLATAWISRARGIESIILPLIITWLARKLKQGPFFREYHTPRIGRTTITDLGERTPVSSVIYPDDDLRVGYLGMKGFVIGAFRMCWSRDQRGINFYILVSISCCDLHLREGRRDTRNWPEIVFGSGDDWGIRVGECDKDDSNTVLFT